MRTPGPGYWNRSGIYKIENTITGECYVGSAVNLGGRKGDHFYHLRHGKHHAKYLQRSYNKHGEEAFIFSVIEECDRGKLRERETYWIQTLKPKYNGTLNTATSLGMKLSEEQKQKLREYNLRPEVVAKKKAELTGHEVKPETIEKIKEARAKQPITDKMLQGLAQGRALPHEVRKGMTGKKHSDATKLKQREAALKQREQRSETMKAVWQEQREQRSEALKIAWQKRKQAKSE